MYDPFKGISAIDEAVTQAEALCTVQDETERGGCAEWQSDTS